MDKCLNCGKPTHAFFEGVPVCVDCAKIAEHMVKKFEMQFAAMMTAQKEVIRTSLVEGRLVLHGNAISDSDGGGAPTSVHEPELPERADPDGSSEPPAW